jgi:hypothetical protein
MYIKIFEFLKIWHVFPSWFLGTHDFPMMRMNFVVTRKKQTHQNSQEPNDIIPHPELNYCHNNPQILI